MFAPVHVPDACKLRVRVVPKVLHDPDLPADLFDITVLEEPEDAAHDVGTGVHGHDDDIMERLHLLVFGFAAHDGRRERLIVNLLEEVLDAKVRVPVANVGGVIVALFHVYEMA